MNIGLYRLVIIESAYHSINHTLNHYNITESSADIITALIKQLSSTHKRNSTCIHISHMLASAHKIQHSNSEYSMTRPSAAVISFDMDGCADLFSKKFRAIVWKEAPYLSPYLKAARTRLISHCIQLRNKATAGEVFIGSNRQSHNAEKRCRDTNHNGSGPETVRLIASKLGMSFNPLVMADITAASASRHTADNITEFMRWLDQDSYGIESDHAIDQPGYGLDEQDSCAHRSVFFEELKTALVRLQLIEAGKKYPDHNVDFYLFDDRKDIIDAVKQYFKDNPNKHPKNVTLHCIRFTSYHALFQEYLTHHLRRNKLPPYFDKRLTIWAHLNDLLSQPLLDNLTPLQYALKNKKTNLIASLIKLHHDKCVPLPSDSESIRYRLENAIQQLNQDPNNRGAINELHACIDTFHTNFTPIRPILETAVLSQKTEMLIYKQLAMYADSSNATPHSLIYACDTVDNLTAAFKCLCTRFSIKQSQFSGMSNATIATLAHSSDALHSLTQALNTSLASLLRVDITLILAMLESPRLSVRTIAHLHLRVDQLKALSKPQFNTLKLYRSQATALIDAGLAITTLLNCDSETMRLLMQLTRPLLMTLKGTKTSSVAWIRFMLNHPEALVALAGPIKQLMRANGQSTDLPQLTDFVKATDSASTQTKQTQCADAAAQTPQAVRYNRGTQTTRRMQHRALSHATLFRRQAQAKPAHASLKKRAKAQASCPFLKPLKNRPRITRDAIEKHNDVFNTKSKPTRLKPVLHRSKRNKNTHSKAAMNKHSYRTENCRPCA